VKIHKSLIFLIKKLLAGDKIATFLSETKIRRNG